MTMNVKKIEAICEEFGYSREKMVAKKKSLQSTKTHLNKNKFAADYDRKLAEVLESIEALNQAINYLNPKAKTVTTYEQADIDKLDFDQTMKAIKSIQSAICNCQYETKNVEDNIKYQSYKKIEKMLLEHKATVKPVDEAYIRKTELEAVINAIETAPDASRENIIEMLKNLL